MGTIIQLGSKLFPLIVSVVGSVAASGSGAGPASSKPVPAPTAAPASPSASAVASSPALQDKVSNVPDKADKIGTAVS